MEDLIRQMKDSMDLEAKMEMPASPFEHSMVQAVCYDKLSESSEGKQQLGLFLSGSNPVKSKIPVRKKLVHPPTPFDKPPPGLPLDPFSRTAPTSKDDQNADAEGGEKHFFQYDLVKQMGSSIDDILNIVKKGGVSHNNSSVTHSTMNSCNNNREGSVEQRSNESITNFVSEVEAT